MFRAISWTETNSNFAMFAATAITVIIERKLFRKCHKAISFVLQQKQKTCDSEGNGLGGNVPPKRVEHCFRFGIPVD